MVPVLHEIRARRDRTSDRTVVYSYQSDKLFHHVSYGVIGVTHSANSQPFGYWDAEENRMDKGKEFLGIFC